METCLSCFEATLGAGGASHCGQCPCCKPKDKPKDPPKPKK